MSLGSGNSSRCSVVGRVGVSVTSLMIVTPPAMPHNIAKFPGEFCTGRPGRMSQRKWRKTKQQPSRARSGHQIICCSVSLHFPVSSVQKPGGCHGYERAHSCIAAAAAAVSVMFRCCTSPLLPFVPNPWYTPRHTTHNYVGACSLLRR